jgi:hypothetical protein
MELVEMLWKWLGTAVFDRLRLRSVIFSNTVKL